MIPGVAHHITQRGNYRQTVFHRNEDRRFYMTLLAEFLPHYGISLQAYCLMPNHVHLIATPHDANGLSRALQRVHSEYARALHMRLRRTGHLWQARFHSVAMDEKHFWAAMLYVERNPVRAGLVEQAGDWAWSSARAHLGLTPNPILDMIEWRTRWNSSSWNSWLSNCPADAELEARIRVATLSGLPLGAEEFRQDLQARFGIQTGPRRPGRPRKLLKSNGMGAEAA